MSSFTSFSFCICRFNLYAGMSNLTSNLRVGDYPSAMIQCQFKLDLKMHQKRIDSNIFKRYWHKKISIVIFILFTIIKYYNFRMQLRIGLRIEKEQSWQFLLWLAKSICNGLWLVSSRLLDMFREALIQTCNSVYVGFVISVMTLAWTSAANNVHAWCTEGRNHHKLILQK